MTTPTARELWQRKLEAYYAELATAVDPEIKFYLQSLIDKAHEKLERLEALGRAQPTALPSSEAPSPQVSLVAPAPSLDASTAQRIARQYFDFLAPLIRRINPAKVGGENRVRSIDLKKLYISLVADPTSFDERRRAHQLELTLAKHTAGSQSGSRHAIRPVPTGIVERVQRNEVTQERSDSPPDGSTPENEPATPGGESLHSVVRRERCSVILGDPGSGKSVLCRWLTRELADSWLLRQPSPELGPARVPFLVILRELAQTCSAGGVDTLVDYLCHQRAETDFVGSEELWRSFVLDTLRAGNACVILDGLDEVPKERMLDMRLLVEAFVRDYIVPSAEPDCRPDSGIGNQVLVTSRVTGYYQTSLASDTFEHFLIRPMVDSQIEEFCRHWCVATERKARTDTLLREIFDKSRPSIRSMARNPLLLSVLCQLGTKDESQAKLPQIRAELYETIIYETAQEWRRESTQALIDKEPYLAGFLMDVDSVLALFSPVAGHIHAHFIDDQINIEDLQEWLIKGLSAIEGKSEFDLSSEEWVKRRDFLMEALGRVVGVLSERSPGQYSFLHRTFQEYLAGTSLLLPENRQEQQSPAIFLTSSEELVDRIIDGGFLADARFRQPLLLLFGQLAWMQICTERGKRRPAPLLAEVVELLDQRYELGEVGMLGEHWALFLAEVLAELPDEMLLRTERVNVVLVRATAQLLDAYDRSGLAPECHRERQMLAEKLAAIRRRLGSEDFENLLLGVCSASRRSERFGAAAHLVSTRGWLSQQLIDTFAEHRSADSPRWNWSVHRLIRQAATLAPFLDLPEPIANLQPPAHSAVRELRRFREALPEWQRATREHGERQIPSRPLVPTTASTHRPSQALLHTNSPTQSLLSAAVLGGYGDYDKAARSRRRQALLTLMQEPSSARDLQLDAEPWRYVPWFGATDTLYTVGVHLDTLGKALYHVAVPPEQQAQFITRADSATQVTLSALESQQDIAAALVEAVRRGDALDLAELMAIARVTGAEPLTAIHSTSSQVMEQVGWHLERIQDDLSDPCLRGTDVLHAWVESLNSSMEAEQWQLLNHTYCVAWSSVGAYGSPLYATSKKAKGSSLAPRAPYPYALSPWMFADVGQRWANMLLSVFDDGKYNFAVAMDTLWPCRTLQESQGLLRGIVASPGLQSRQLRLPNLLELGTGVSALPPLAFYTAALEVTELIEEKYSKQQARAWLSTLLHSWISLDPVARYCAAYHGDDLQTLGSTATKPVEDEDINTPAELLKWRAWLGAVVAPIGVRVEKIGALWHEAWQACTTQEHQLTLLRDSVALGLHDQLGVLDRLSSLVPKLTTRWCTDGALLCGQIASRAIEGKAQWLALALDCLERSDAPGWIAWSLAEVAPLIADHGTAEEQRRCEALLRTLPVHLQAAATGQLASWTRVFNIEHWPEDPQVQQALVPTLLIAASVEQRKDRSHTGQISSTLGALWDDLTHALKARLPEEEGLRLVKHLVQLAGSRSLQITSSALQALRTAASRPQLATRYGVAYLLPLVTRPAGELLNQLRDLRLKLSRSRLGAAGGFVDSLRDHVILWLCEAEQRISMESLAALKRLVLSMDDRSAARAMVALHGPEIVIRDRPARYMLSTLVKEGVEGTMLELGRASVLEPTLERCERLASLALYEFAIDEPTMLRRWLGELSNDPTNIPLLSTVFYPWRWSAECLQIWSKWVQTVTSPVCLQHAAYWFSVLQVAATETAFDHLPPTGLVWPGRNLPAVHWISRRDADRKVATALFHSLQTEDQASKQLDAARRHLLQLTESLHGAAAEGAETLASAWISLGNAVTQRIGEVPETAWPYTVGPDWLWTEPHVQALVEWNWADLVTWEQDRLSISLAHKVTCSSQLCLLACLADSWPSAIRHAAKAREHHNPAAPTYPSLLCTVIRFFPCQRAVQAAWIVLAHVCGPELGSNALWAVLSSSMRDIPIIRSRAILALSSNAGKNLAAALTPETVESALKQWSATTSGNMVVALAGLFQVLAKHPATEPQIRRDIQLYLRQMIQRKDAFRPLNTLTGLGTLHEPFVVSTGRRLEEELRALEAELRLQSEFEF